MNYYKHSNNFWVQKHVYDRINGTGKFAPRPSIETPKPWHIKHEKLEINRVRNYPTFRNTGETLLYRYFSKVGELLYVGITCNKEGRHKAHSKYSPWFQTHEKVEYQRFEKREDAAKAEVNIIKEENPKWNVVHKRLPNVQLVG